MSTAIIVSASDNDVIGSHGKRAWAQPAERTLFEETVGHNPVIIGRKSYQDFGQNWLKKATSIVLSRNAQMHFSDAYTSRTLKNAIELAEFSGSGKVFIAGGESVFAEALPLVDRIYLTRVHFITSGNAFFHLPTLGWKIIAIKAHQADQNNPYPFDTIVYQKV